MDDKGNIRHFSREEAEQMWNRRLMEAKRNMRHEWAPLTDAEAAFFKSKGTAFRELWGKRLSRGLTVEQRATLDALVAEHSGRERADA